MILKNHVSVLKPIPECAQTRVKCVLEALAILILEFGVF